MTKKEEKTIKELDKLDIIKELDDKVMLYNWFPLTLRDKIINVIIRYYKKKKKKE